MVAQPAFDARPLTEPVAPGAPRAFVRELRQTGRLPGMFSGSSAITALIVGVFVVVFGAIFLTMFVSIFAAVSAGLAQQGGIAPALATLLPFLILAVVVALGAVGVVAAIRSGATRMYRLDRFARANGMTYVPRLDTPALPGMIFSLGSSRQASDLVRGEQPRFVEFGNYRYTTGSGKNKTTHHWGYVAVRLDAPLPHIVLDATGNNALFGSNLPLSFDRDQRLSLEGDFDRHFALYCPAGYERDALYLFTPDIMARFIDNAAALDVEIIDDWLFLYAKRDFSTLDPSTWAWLFSVVGALLGKLAQWSRWRDDHLRAEARSGTDASTAAPPSVPVTAGAASALPFASPLETLRPPPGVAPQGRRLQRGVPWASFVVVGAVVLFWILSNSGFFGMLLGR